jgi:hypothetical protein
MKYRSITLSGCNREVLLSILFVMVVTMLTAQGIQPESNVDSTHYHPLTLGLLYPISTNHTRHDSTGVSLALLQNSVGNVRGVHLCGFSAVSTGTVRGIQASALYSQIDNDLHGASFSTINVVNDNVTGMQMAVGANLLGRSFKGGQSAGAVNFIGGHFSGYQQSAVFNIVGKSFRGAQVAGAGNVVGGNFGGVQLGTTFNFVGRVFRGFQTAFVNVAAESRGCQFGWGNIAQVNHGWQIGFLNLAEDQQGVPVGLVNISDDGDVQWQSYASNFAQFVTAVRFVSGNFVSSLELGHTNLESDNESSVLFGFHYGYRISYRNWAVETDVGFFHVEYELDDDSSDIPASFALQMRFSATCRLTDWLELYAGIGGSTMAEYVFDDNAQTTETEDRFLYFAGINLF